MIGAIIGDTVGSRFEFDNIHTKEFEFLNSECEPTDDSIMTIAIADAIIEWDKTGRENYEVLSDYTVKAMRSWGSAYPNAGYGGHFYRWLRDKSMGPYNSCGNGSAMRISPVGWAARDLEECKRMSFAVTAVTHNHPDGIMGAEATAVQIFLARQGYSKEMLKQYEEENYYTLHLDMPWYRKHYKWESLCNGTCQPAFQCLYDSKDFEDSIRNCISIGGDCDTTAAICGAVSQAVYGIPKELESQIRSYLDKDQLAIVDSFNERFVLPYGRC